MKKYIIFLTICLLPLFAGAQNRAIEQLAEKYSGRDGFSSTVIKGRLASGFNGSIRIQDVDISNIIKEISSIILVSSDAPDEEFSRDVALALETEEYATVASTSSDGEQIRFLLATLPEAKNGRKQSEFVIAVSGAEENLLVSVVGEYVVAEVIASP